MLCRGEFKHLKIEYGKGYFPEEWHLLKDIEVKANRKRITCPWDTVEMNGIYTIRVHGIKKDNTLREDSAWIYIDNTAPVTKLHINGGMDYEDKDIVTISVNDSFTLNAKDPEINNYASGIGKTFYKIINQGGGKTGAWKEWDGESISLDEGEYVVKYYSVDKAGLPGDPPGLEEQEEINTGNIERINTTTVIVQEAGQEPDISIVTGEPAGSPEPQPMPNTSDTTPPGISVTGIANGKYYNYPVCADIRIYDENLSEYYIVLKKDGEIQLSKTGQKNTNYKICVQEEAEYELIVEARDESSNIANTYMEFGIDKTSPIVEITGVEDGGEYYNETQPVVIDIIEAHAERMWTNLQHGSLTNTQYTNTAFFSGDILVKQGEYKLEAGSEDKAENITEKKIQFKIIGIDSLSALIFKAEYNTNTDADYGEGSTKNHSGAKITEGTSGKQGEALKCFKHENSSDSHYARYSSKSNIDKSQGTIMMWVKPGWSSAANGSKGEDLGRHIFSLYENKDKTNAAINFVIFKDQGTTAQIRYVKNGTNMPPHVLNADKNLDESERWYKDGETKWSHLALTWDLERGIIKIYIDGNLAGKKEEDKWVPYHAEEYKWMKIGDASKGVNKEFNGYIDRFKIYKIQLTDQQVNQIYEEEK